MERATQTIKTESGAEVTIYSYMTGGELMQFEEITNDPNIKLAERGEKLLGLMVVSVDGETDRVKAVEAVKQLPSYEFSEVIQKIKALVTNEDEAGKKK